jgi:hypothetical protein
MMKARLDQLFALEAPDKSAADSTQLRLPTLEERVELYLRAVYGEREVTREEYLRARDLILDVMATPFSGDTVVGPANKPSGPVDLPGRPVSLADQTISWDSSRALSEFALRLGPVQQAASARPSDELEGPPTGPDARVGSPAAMPPAWKLSKHRRFIGGFSVGFTAVLLLGVGIHIVTLFSIDGGQMTAIAPDPGFVSPPPASLEIYAQPVQRSEGVAVLQQRTPSKLQLNDEEIGTLVARGRELIQAGDIDRARLVLEQAAEAGNATAALELGGTYDPVILLEIQDKRIQEKRVPPSAFSPAGLSPPGIHPLVADLALAKAWYEKARDLGSTEATALLDRLGNVPIPRRRPQ